jgi:hypothetical protein
VAVPQNASTSSLTSFIRAEAPAMAAISRCDGDLPIIIQGGLGVAVSNWRLARAVSQYTRLSGLNRQPCFRNDNFDPST